MDATEPNAELDPTRVALLRSRDPRALRDAVLVLQARSIDFELVREAQDVTLVVDAVEESTARRELLAFARENSGPRGEPFQPRLGGPLAAALWAVALALAYQAQLRGFGGHDWRDAGLMDAAKVQAGELWRSATALTLHADPTHLLSNVLFGAVFLVLLGQGVGGGAALALTFGGGTVGNLANAWLRGAGHFSLGASTAVFAALGALIVAEYLRRDRSPAPADRARRAAPLIAGVALLGWLGVGGENTDVTAHLTGFAGGCLLGLATRSKRVDSVLENPGAQLVLGALAALGMALAWALALR